MLVLVAANVASTYFCGAFARHNGNGIRMTLFFNGCWMTAAAVFCAVTAIVQGGFPGGIVPDASGCVLGVLAGLCFACLTFFYILSLKKAAVATAMMVSTAGVVLVCISGPLVFHEPMGFKQAAGIVVILIAVAAITRGERSGGRLDVKTVCFLFLTMLFNGSIMFLQKYYPFTHPTGGNMGFMAITFVVGAAVSFPAAAVCRGCLPEAKTAWGSFVLPCVGNAVAMLAVNQLSMVISRLIPAAVQFPTQTIAVLLLGTVMSVIVFRERVTPARAIGMGIGIAGILLLNL